MKKRILSLALVLMLCLSLLPMAALAAENDGYTALSGADSFKGWDGTGSAPDVPYKVHDDLIGGDIYYLPAGYYKLSNDISEISITITGDVTLDLNGKTMTGSSSGPALVVGSISAPIGNLTIQDSTSGAGSVTSSWKAISVYKGSLTLESGTVSCSSTGTYAISADNGCTVTLQGGTVSGTICLFYSNSTLNADGGTVSGAVNNEGGTITRSSDSVTTATEFTGTVNNGGTILWGTYTSAGTVENGYEQDETNSLIGTISGGTFYGKVKNNSYTGMFGDTRSSSITGGDFSQATQRTGVYSVTFDLNGASGTAPATQWRAKGTATQPDDPTPPTANDRFVGWYEKDDTGAFKDTAFNFANTAITANITLYAKWECAGHTGGTATCKEKAKCEVCHEEYGEINAANHATLKHVEAKAATIEAEGNVEYWYCEDCGKYYSDKDSQNEIALSDTVIEKLTPTPAPTAAPTATPAPTAQPKAPNTADEANGTLWLALAMLSMMAVVVVARKKEG